MLESKTVDLIETLKRIEEEAARAYRRVTTGEAPKGTLSLNKIRCEAADALVRAGLERRSPTELAR